MPLTDVVTQMSTYAKFFKEILSNRRKLEDVQTVTLTENVSALVMNKSPEKLKDPGNFTIPCTIGNTNSYHALCDLGASVSLMPKSIYDKISVCDLKSTKISLQLADRSIRLPLGVIEDVPIQVGKFFIPTDFMVIDMEEDNLIPLLLGRQFLATAGALIDARDGKIIIRVGEEKIEFEASKSLKYPSNDHTICRIDEIEACVAKEIEESPQVHPIEHSISNSGEEGKHVKLMKTFQHLSKEETKRWHDKLIVRRPFQEGEKVLLFNSRFKLFAGKLRSKWTGPFEVIKVFPHGAIEIWSERTGAFKVNGQQLKHYVHGESSGEHAMVALIDAQHT